MGFLGSKDMSTSNRDLHVKLGVRTTGTHSHASTHTDIHNVTTLTCAEELRTLIGREIKFNDISGSWILCTIGKVQNSSQWAEGSDKLVAKGKIDLKVHECLRSLGLPHDMVRKCESEGIVLRSWSASLDLLLSVV